MGRVSCEIPSGMLADRFSYKTNLYLAACPVLDLLSWFYLVRNFWIYAIAMMMVNAWSYNFDSGTSTAFLFDSAVEAGQKTVIFRFLVSCLVAEVTRTFRYSGGRLLYSRSIGLDLLYCYQAILAFHSFDLSDEGAESKSDERSHLTLKRILEVVKQEMAGQTSLVFTGCHLSVGRTIMCMFYFYYQKISDLTSWQVSLIIHVDW